MSHSWARQRTDPSFPVFSHLGLLQSMLGALRKPYVPCCRAWEWLFHTSCLGIYEGRIQGPLPTGSWGELPRNLRAQLGWHTTFLRLPFIRNKGQEIWVLCISYCSLQLLIDFLESKNISRWEPFHGKASMSWLYTYRGTNIYIMITGLCIYRRNRWAAKVTQTYLCHR